MNEDTYRDRLSLAGEWQFDLDPDDRGIEECWFSRELMDSIEIPGSTDERCKSSRNEREETERLTRLYPYVGPAFYRKTVVIPESWEGKPIYFSIERTKHSTAWVDGNFAGTRDSLTTPHTYDLGEWMTPGSHDLTVRIDNANLPPLGDGHQTSEHTQTNWNGLLGTIELVAREINHITGLQAYPNVAERSVRLRLTFSTACSGHLSVRATAENSAREHRVQQSFEFVADDCGAAEVVLDLGDGMQCWDEFSPSLYRLGVTVAGHTGDDCREVRVGMRDFLAVDGQFQVNGRATFLRGKHDACVFPLTGYAPMEAEEWNRIFTTAKAYGINHYRFHSWCPPDAAFAAADEVGIYLQPELPLWESIGVSNVDPMGDVEFKASGDETVMEQRIRYLVQEGIRLLREFGNHPSFCMFALGNELSGDLDTMASLVRRFRQEDPRHLYAHGSNNFIFEPTQSPADDYWTTMMTGGNYRRGEFKPNSRGREVRGSFCAHDHGHVNNCYPGTRGNYRSALEGIAVPVIGHEVGQYQVFPNFNEIEKYTGVLRARNLARFRRNLEAAGMGDLDDDFFNASGALSVLCYREDIEAALRTPGFGGFQLLDLQDFPGQGTALVGILDAFMESKGLIAPEAWREFCNDVVLLAEFDKYTWTSSETFAADLRVAYYGCGAIENARISWKLATPDGLVAGSGETGCQSVVEPGVHNFGSISVDLSGVAAPEKLCLSLHIEGTDYRNHYPVWAYDDQAPIVQTSVLIADSLDDNALGALAAGGRVLMLPEASSVAEAVPGAFQTDFWCYPMFKKYDPPGTMGILCDPEHPALAEFPTEYHSNWQWWPLLKNGCAMILDDLPGDLDPIVRVIDNFERSHRLGVVFECRVGQGKLLVCSCNVQQDYPEAKQLLKSLLSYMNSDQFQPCCCVAPESLKRLLHND